eukprot:9414377-Lingulodinium_polyedra.AAC.1
MTITSGSGSTASTTAIITAASACSTSPASAAYLLPGVALAPTVRFTPVASGCTTCVLSLRARHAS